MSLYSWNCCDNSDHRVCDYSDCGSYHCDCCTMQKVSSNQLIQTLVHMVCITTGNLHS